MSHNHIEQGDYGKKHSDVSKADESIIEAIEKKVDDTHLSCASAERIAKDLGIPLVTVGFNADLKEIKIDKCQLGLFGYHRTKGQKRAMKPAADVDEKLKEAITGALNDGKLTCETTWKIASRLNVTRMEVCSAADGMGIKTSTCQLGTF